MTDDNRDAMDPARLGARLGADDAQEARDFEDIAAQLGLAAEPVEPPAAMKAALFARLAETPQLAADEATAAGVETARPIVPASTAPEPRPTAQTPAEARAARRWFQRPGAILASAAAAVVLFIAGAFVGVSLGGNDTYQQQQSSALAALNAAPDTQRSTAPITGGGTATLVWSARLGQSAIVATDLPQLAGGKTYELWYIRDGAATAAGTMDSAGHVATWRVLTGTMTPGDTIGMTVEPSGGSKQPTTKPIVAINS
ncbi:anti-sigma factor domain-containing protein [Leifsonia sp. NPDC056824]|uniref:anti-sigma factor n=1 Tax=Leifsonia sp. NPDC056824 TaxID=3345953 RepID=UPI003673BCFA